MGVSFRIALPTFVIVDFVGMCSFRQRVVRDWNCAVCFLLNVLATCKRLQAVCCLIHLIRFDLTFHVLMQSSIWLYAYAKFYSVVFSSWYSWNLESCLYFIHYIFLQYAQIQVLRGMDQSTGQMVVSFRIVLYRLLFTVKFVCINTADTATAAACFWYFLQICSLAHTEHDCLQAYVLFELVISKPALCLI